MHDTQRMRGFTIVELLVSMVLLVTVFAGVMPLIYGAINNNKDARLKLIAYEAANQKIEELRDDKIPSLIAPNHIYFTVDGIDNSSGDLFVTKPLGDSRIAKVECTITWNFRGRNHSINLSTYMYGGNS